MIDKVSALAEIDNLVVNKKKRTAKKEHRTSVKLANSGAIIKATTCGTAMVRTVYVNVNCEMTVRGAQYLAQRILEEANWIASIPKDCKDCENKKDCPEVEA